MPLQTKIVLIITTIIIVVGTLFIIFPLATTTHSETKDLKPFELVKDSAYLALDARLAQVQDMQVAELHHRVEIQKELAISNYKIATLETRIKQDRLDYEKSTAESDEFADSLIHSIEMEMENE